MGIKDMEKEYAAAQFQVIADLQKKLARLEEENKSLQLMLEGTVPLIQNPTMQITGITNEQLICETQIKRLKDAACERELTLEESRKFQIFVDTLQKIRPEKGDELNADAIPEADLLQLVTNESGK
jgi:hypothetical protein